VVNLQLASIGKRHFMANFSFQEETTVRFIFALWQELK